MEIRIYKVGDILSVSGSRSVNKDLAIKGDNSENYYTPYICRGKSNNGCEGYFNYTPSQMKNCITIGSQGATAFYQFLDFFTGTGVIILRNEKLNENNSLYIVTSINKILNSYGYGYEVSQDKLKQLEISLPSIIHEDGTYEPDWNYMEKYIADLKKKVNIYTQTKIDVIENVKKHRNEKIDVSEWREYRINEIFDISGVKSTKEKLDIKNIPNNEYSIALIGEGDENNQIKGYVKCTIFDNSNIITCNRFSGRCFYQIRNCVIQGTSSAKLVLKNNILSENLAMFLLPILNLNISDFSRANKRCSSDLNSEKISLPSIIHEDGTYEPDWDYMEKYVKKLKGEK